jgi:hypothetical protein
MGMHKETKETITTLTQCFESVIWMAIRYANGRHTYAPSDVRHAIKMFQKVYPSWKPQVDITIKKPNLVDEPELFYESDYLWDLVNNEDEREKENVQGDVP